MAHANDSITNDEESLVKQDTNIDNDNTEAAEMALRTSLTRTLARMMMHRLPLMIAAPMMRNPLSELDEIQ